VTISVLCPGLVASGLGRGHRPDGIAPPGGNPDFTAAMQARAMAAEPVAKHAVDGTLKGEFLIVTHPHAVKAAQRRHAEVEAAFAAQAPYTEDSERYNVQRVLADLGAARLLEPHQAGDAEGEAPDVGDGGAFVQAAGQPVQGLVGALVGEVRAAPVEEAREGQPQRLVGLGGPGRIAVEPDEEPLEGRGGELPRRGHRPQYTVRA